MISQRRAPYAATALLLLGLPMSVAAASPAIGGSGRVQRVSTAGEVLYEYEALVHQIFGSSISVCTGGGGCHQGWFYRGDLAPLSEYSPFTYVFSGFTSSTFHLMPAGFAVAGGFGNYPDPIKVNGRLVACDRAEKTFLISYGDAVGDGNLACLAPA